MDRYRIILILLVAIASKLGNARPKANEENIAEELHGKQLDAELDWMEVNKGLDYFEGDIILPDEQQKASTYSAMVEQTWTNNIVPYKIEENAYGFEDRMLIFESLSEFNVRTCVTFRPMVESDTNFVHIRSTSGCSSAVGMSGGEQKLSIGGGCESKRTIQHEAMHALGFWHEQNRPDRDDYVEILLENVVDGYGFNFKNVSNSRTLGLEYDFHSFMHYGSKYFSKNEDYTIKVALPYRSFVSEEDLGSSNELTELDLTKIRTLYNCDLSKYKEWSEWTDWSACDNDCFRQRWRYCNDEDINMCSGEKEQFESESCINCVLNSVTDCGPVEYTGWGGSISSPLYPYAYKNDAECQYIIKRKFDDYPIFLSFVAFSIEDVKAGCIDKLEIHDLANPDVLCGENLPSDRMLHSSEPILRFISDSTIKKPGFKVFYFNVPVRHHCPFEFEPWQYGWTQDENDDFDWTWIAGETISDHTGPTTDHSTGNIRGHYIYIEVSSQKKDDVARIMTPEFSPTSQDNCIQFYYHMYGKYTGTLNVYAVDTSTGSEIEGSRFTKIGDQGDKWTSAFLPISQGVQYKVVFEAIAGETYISDIAIDDFRAFNIACSSLD